MRWCWMGLTTRARNSLTNYAAFVLLSLLSACSSGIDDGPAGRAIVGGVVTLDGQPLPSADVVFEPQSGAISMGRTDEKGDYFLQYSLDEAEGGLPAGRYTVRITTAGLRGLRGRKPAPERIPARYNHFSELIAEVESGENTINFQLKSEGLVIQPHETEKLAKHQSQKRK